MAAGRAVCPNCCGLPSETEGNPQQFAPRPGEAAPTASQYRRYGLSCTKRDVNGRFHLQ